MSDGYASTAMRKLNDVGFKPTLPALLAQAVDRFGDDDLILLPNRGLTFREADRRSRLLARRLVELGAGKGSRIAVFYPSSTEFVVAFLAIARIGGIALLLSSTMKPAELRIALRLGDAAMLLAPRALVGRETPPMLEEAIEGLAGAGTTLRLPAMPYLRHVLLEDADGVDWATPMWPEVEPSVSDNLLTGIESEVHPADDMLMIWTSGSTALPKGVVHAHGATIRKVAPETGLGLQTSYPGRTLLAMPLFWVGGMQCLLGAMYSGATLLCLERFDPGDAIDLIIAGKASGRIMGWPFMLERLSTHPKWSQVSGVSLEGPRPTPPSSLGGLLNLGMTETFGRHLPGPYFDYRIVDPETGAILGEGQEGEFRVRGAGLMTHMYKREREETFDRDGFYPTGDKGYIEGGSAFFTGRYGEMIKSAGANVSPTEVEAVVATLPDVRNVVVLGVESEGRGTDVAAVVAVAEGATLTEDAVIAHCRKQLSGYKIPRRVKLMPVTEFPMLVTGKADRRTIKQMF